LKKNVRLGVFTDDFSPIKGGIGRHINDIYLSFPDRQVVFFSPSKNSVKNHVLVRPPLYQLLKHIALSLFLIFKMNFLVKKYNLTTINVHAGPGGLFLLRKPSKKLIVTSHHTYWQQSHYIAQEWWKRLFIPFEKRTYAVADRIIAVSEDTKNILIKKYGISDEKVRVIPNVVDTTRFYPLKTKKKIPKSVLYIGRIDKRKGVHFLLEAAKVVISRDSSIQFYIGGKGKDLSAMKNFVRQKNIAKNIHFLGFVPDDELNEWYNKVSVAVVPSIFEGFGITCIEAMAAGTPVIGTNVDGLRSIIKQGKNGWLVDYGDIESLSKAIMSLALSNNYARTSHERKYEINYIIKKYSEVYF